MKITTIKKLLLVALIMMLFCCGQDKNSSDGVGALVVVNSAGTTGAFNSRFAVPDDWKEHSLWDFETPVSITPGETFKMPSSSELHDFQVIIGSHTYNHYDSVKVDADYSTYVYIHSDGSISVDRYMPYE